MVDVMEYVLPNWSVHWPISGSGWRGGHWRNNDGTSAQHAPDSNAVRATSHGSGRFGHSVLDALSMTPPLQHPLSMYCCCKVSHGVTPDRCTQTPHADGGDAAGGEATALSKTEFMLPITTLLLL